MARRSIPYPPSPAWVHADLTAVGRESTRDVIAVMTGLFLFLGLYGFLIALALALAGVVAGIVLSFRSFGICAGLPLGLVRRHAADGRGQAGLTRRAANCHQGCHAWQTRNDWRKS